MQIKLLLSAGYQLYLNQFNRSIQETKKYNTFRYDTVEMVNSLNPQIGREAKVEGKL